MLTAKPVKLFEPETYHGCPQVPLALGVNTVINF